MCGIFASPYYQGTRLALADMRHRGPDDLNVLGAADFFVGFVRLRIVDSFAPEAAQPYESARGRIIAFNGEVYNYESLDPTTPSEVALIAALLDEGLDPRQHIDGDYAILSYEPSQRRLVLYRDRFGSCPLYYQTKPFVAVSSERRRLENPKEVPAHGRVVIDIAACAVVDQHAFPHYGVTSEHLSMAVFKQELLRAVASRAVHSDSGFSVAFSGGLDSSLLLYALHELELRPKAVITTYFSKESEDLRVARIVAQRLGLKLTEIEVGNEPEAEVRCIREHLDTAQPPTPLRWRGGLRTWGVAKHSPTRVVLCGDGADELVAGYPQHFAMENPKPYRVNARSLTSIRSMPVVNLDRTNKLGMAFSREFRSPFLASRLSYLLLSSSRDPGKALLRDTLRFCFGAPPALWQRSKYSADEVAIEALPAGAQ